MTPENEQRPERELETLETTAHTSDEDRSTPRRQDQRQVIDFDSISAADLEHLADLKRQQEEATRQRFWDMLDQPSLGHYRAERQGTDWRTWVRPVALPYLTAVAAEMSQSGWPHDVIATALIGHAQSSGWADLTEPALAVRRGLHAGARAVAA